jgi:hypothetical protein
MLKLAQRQIVVATKVLIDPMVLLVSRRQLPDDDCLRDAETIVRIG